MKKSKQDQTINRILFAAGILCLIVFVTTGFLLLNYVHESRQQEKLAKQLAELKHGNDREAMYVKAEPVETTVQNEGADSFIREQHTEEGMIPVEEPSKDEQEMGQDISQGSELIVQQQLTEINADYVMWLQIADTVIDYPVVQRDNDYYLKHDFYGEKSKHGTIFLDEECDAKGKFLLLHGHHMKDDYDVW